jgi:hypothetical protein
MNDIPLLTIYSDENIVEKEENCENVDLWPMFYIVE